MRKAILFFVAAMITFAGYSQKYNVDSALNVLRMQKDSTLHAMKVQKDSAYHASIHTDSVKTNKEFDEKEKWEKLKGITTYPVLKAGEFSGVITVNNPTEIPDPKMEYKLLFELTENNPDSIAKEINGGLTEVARKINLHVASGVPLKNIIPVVVVHAGALFAFTTNDYYKQKYKIDNPNIKVVNELKNLGARFIACGQAMAFIGLKKDDLLPDMKISVTAQTALSNYQLKGFVKY
jgi:intracellular sulfur oxidation DsrE/DsrF family protein